MKRHRHHSLVRRNAIGRRRCRALPGGAAGWRRALLAVLAVGLLAGAPAQAQGPLPMAVTAAATDGKIGGQGAGPGPGAVGAAAEAGGRPPAISGSAGRDPGAPGRGRAVRWCGAHAGPASGSSSAAAATTPGTAKSRATTRAG